jgi:hypothetical protein
MPTTVKTISHVASSNRKDAGYDAITPNGRIYKKVNLTGPLKIFIGLSMMWEAAKNTSEKPLGEPDQNTLNKNIRCMKKYINVPKISRTTNPIILKLENSPG